MQKPLLTVCLITYNHAKFIRQAVESVLMQETNFSWELIIADDCSTDGTRDIIEEYRKKFPERIRLILQERNVGAARNWLDLITSPTSAYIAYFEGDDYWTDPHKLQKQVDFLEAKSEYVACYHDVTVVDEEGKPLRKSKNSFIHNRDLTQEELMGGRVMSMLSLCFRNVVKPFPEEFYQSPAGDNFLCSLLGNHGKGKYLADVGASAYRMHPGGAWSLKDDTKKRMTLLRSYFWIWQYYVRTGKPDVAKLFYRKVLLEGFYSNPFWDVKPIYLGKLELATVKIIRKVFRLLRFISTRPDR